MLVYTDSRKYIKLDHYQNYNINSSEDGSQDDSQDDFIDCDSNFAICSLDDIQYSLSDIYAKQLYSSDKSPASAKYCEHHIILDINNMLHIISVHDGKSTLHKDFCETVTNNARIVHFNYITSNDNLHSEARDAMTIIMVDIVDKLVMYNIHISILPNNRLEYMYSTKIHAHIGKLHDVYDGYITLKLHDDSTRLLWYNDKHMDIIDDDPIDPKYNGLDIYEYVKDGILYACNNVYDLVESPFDMTNYKIKSYHYNDSYCYEHEKYIHILLLVDENNDAFVYVNFTENMCQDINDFKHIGKIVGDYHAFMAYNCFVIMQPNKLQFIDVQDMWDIETNTGDFREVPSMTEHYILSIQGKTFSGYTWNRSTHRYLSKERRQLIETFMICNKRMGIFRIPYYVLCKIFTYLVM